jgi:hypothetical protein
MNVAWLLRFHLFEAGHAYDFHTPPNGEKMTRALVGPNPPIHRRPGQCGTPITDSRFDSASFSTAYPFLVVISLDESVMPVSVTLKTFNPFIRLESAAFPLPL